jgi:uncharacterized small protein (DUF1192 family)
VAIEALIEAFLDIWAHDCIAQDSLEMRLSILERVTPPGDQDFGVYNISDLRARIATLTDERDRALAWKADALTLLEKWERVAEKLDVGATGEWKVDEIGRSRAELALERVASLVEELQRLAPASPFLSLRRG